MIAVARALQESTFLSDVRAGLTNTPKSLPCKYLYDDRGSALFEEICDTPEYYPTRTELAILEQHAEQIADALGGDCLLIEPGAGAGIKTRRLLSALDEPAGYVPIEISRSALEGTIFSLRQDFPSLAMAPIHGDFTQLPHLAPYLPPARRRVVFFPASTIGNFAPADATALLRRFARWAGPTGGVLIGVDLLKDRDVLRAAYNDSQGVTAKFNRNILVRINRELRADFPIDHFAHQSVFNEENRRIEMHLLSLDRCQVTIDGESFWFRKNESICTEHSYKYSLSSFASIARQAGLSVADVWTDERAWFSLQWLVP